MSLKRLLNAPNPMNNLFWKSLVLMGLVAIFVIVAHVVGLHPFLTYWGFIALVGLGLTGLLA